VTDLDFGEPCTDGFHSDECPGCGMTIFDRDGDMLTTARAWRTPQTSPDRYPQGGHRMRTPADLSRELQKITDTVAVAVGHFASQARADAALHMATTVRPNPLTVAMEAALADLVRLIDELNTGVAEDG